MKDFSKTKIARVYSTALYEAAEENSCVEKVWRDIVKIKGLLHQNSELVAYLSSPLWSENDKKDVLQKAAKILKIDEETRSCLEIVVSNGRIGDLPAILDGFAKVYYQKNNVIEVEVETVKKLSETQDENLRVILEKILAKNVLVNYNINPTILGGLRIKCGSRMYDDCLATKLNYLENVMKGK